MADLLQQLGITQGMAGQVSGEPAGVDISALRELPEGNDFVVVFLRSRAELEQLARKLVAAVRQDGLIWICFPRAEDHEGDLPTLAVKTDLSADDDWHAMDSLGYGPVQQEILEARDRASSWLALRFARQSLH